MQISGPRSRRLGERLSFALASATIRAPKSNESEPSYTRSVLAPLVRASIQELTGIPLQFRGDGGDAQAIPAFALDIPFFPDLAVSSGNQNLWAAEVKVLRARHRQGAIAAALGQATLYRTRYEHVSVVLIDTAPTAPDVSSAFASEAGALGLNLIIRARIGNGLLPPLQSPLD